MRNISRVLQLCFLVIVLAFSTSVASAAYDQTFPTVKLRHGFSYNFHDTFNAGSRDAKLVGFEVSLTEGGNYNRASGPSFGPSTEVQNQGPIIPANTSRRVLSSQGSYSIIDYPVRRKSDNISIVYDISYQLRQNDGTFGSTRSHTEYQPYTITWCGDGVRDNYIDQYNGRRVRETCDPNDSSRAGFGNGGCSSTCQPITIPEPPKCTGVSVSPMTGYAPLNTNIACSGENNSTFRIEVLRGGTVIQNFNSRTANYRFNNAGNYSVRCYVDNTITSSACQKPVTVNPTPPTPTCDSLTVNPHTGHPGLTSSFECNGTAASSYQVEITRDGNTVRTFNTRAGSFTFNQAGNYQVECRVNGTITNNACRKPVTITTPPVEDDYDLALRKTLVGGGTTFRQGDEVTFDIEVINQGDVAANNVQVTDYIPNGLTLLGTHWTQSGNIATRDFGYVPVGGSRIIQIRFRVDGDVIGSIRNFAEISIDDGNDCDSTPDNTNGNQSGETDATGMVDDAIGNGCNPGGDEDDHDFAEITVEDVPVDVYDLALIKTVVGSGPYNRGDDVTFNIRVTNQGNVDSGEVEVTDYIPTGLILNDTTWTLSGSVATRRVSNITPGNNVILPITFTIADDAPASITNLAEISEDDGDDCDSTPNEGPNNDGTPTDNEDGTGCEPGGDEDDHDPETIPVGDGTVRYDLALAKTLVADQNLSRGGRVAFTIRVTNQGNVDANYVQVTDYIPSGLTLDDTAWSLVGGNAQRTINFIAAGNSVDLPITFIIDNDAPANIDNYAEISADDGDDCDSTPDNTNRNGSGEEADLVDNAIGTACEPGGDEDDHDIESISLEVNPAVCTSLTASPSSAINSLTSTLSCSGNNVSTYRIEVRNSAGNLVDTVNGQSGSVTLSSVGTYTASCFVDSQTTAVSACTRTLSVNPSGTSTSSGGGGTVSCSDIIRDSSNTYTCFGNNRTRSIALECGRDADGNPVYLSPVVGDSLVRQVSGRRTAQFNCSDPNPRCYVKQTEDTTISSSEIGSWTTSAQCEIQDNPICGDGVVQPENGEQCDLGSLNGTSSACSSTCTVSTSSSGGGTSTSSGGGSSSSGGGSSGGGYSCSDDNSCVLTFPNGGELTFGPVGNEIIGHGANPLDKTGSPYLFNNSDYDLSFEQFCIKRTSSDTNAGQNALESSHPDGERCIDIQNDMIYAYERVEFADYSVYPNFEGNKDGVSGPNYGDAVLKTSVKDDIDGNGTIEELYNAYFAAELDVRVAKPAVVTVGGGTSFVKDSSTTADVYEVTKGALSDADAEQNKNFVGASASDSVISSFADEVTDNSAITDIEQENADYVEVVESVTNTSTSATNTPVAYNSVSSNYNGLSNVYIVSGSNVRVNSMSDLPAINGPTTFIVEGGDLNIGADITSSENIAFVVKGGDINITAANVETLDGTYIAIPVSGNGGSISSVASAEQLTVNGSLYGDLTNLVANRYYIDEQAGQLSVGTIVSFGSEIFTKPAPLVSQFIGEYLESDKVAR